MSEFDTLVTRAHSNFLKSIILIQIVFEHNLEVIYFWKFFFTPGLVNMLSARGFLKIVGYQIEFQNVLIQVSTKNA